VKIYFIAFMIVSLLFFKSYNYGIKSLNNQYDSPNYIVMAHKIRDKVATKLSKRYNMRVIGVTGGMADCVKVMGLSFQIRGPLSKTRLREIVVDCVEEFLIPINADEQLRPFLKNYPFTANELEIELFIVDDSGIKVYDPEIMIAAESSGEIRYLTYERDAKFGYKSTVDEDYDTALKIVKGLVENPDQQKQD
jgi:hypothetical protein